MLTQVVGQGYLKMALVSQYIAEDGFQYAIDSGWLSTFGELDYTPDVTGDFRHERAMRRLWPLKSMVRDD